MPFDLSALKSFLKGDGGKISTKAGVLGIDIGTSAIKVVQIKEVKGVPTLETYGEMQLGPYEGVDLGRDTRLPEGKVIEALADIIRESGATAKGTAFALSYGSTFTTVITIPSTDVEEIGTMIPVEARKYIPIPLTKVNLEWFPIAVHEEKKQTNVLISAVYTDAITRYETYANGIASSATISEIEIFSSIRSLLSPEDTAVAILEFGAISTRMYIVVNGTIHKTHSVLLSGVALTQALEKGLAISFSQAEKIKRTYGLHGKEDDPRIQMTLISGLERGLRELHTVLKRYEEEEQQKVKKIIISGGGASLKGLTTYVQDMFSHPVVLGTPFTKVAYPAFLEDTLKEAGPTFAVGIGVALRVFQETQ